MVAASSPKARAEQFADEMHIVCKDLVKIEQYSTGSTYAVRVILQTGKMHRFMWNRMGDPILYHKPDHWYVDTVGTLVFVFGSVEGDKR